MPCYKPTRGAVSLWNATTFHFSSLVFEVGATAVMHMHTHQHSTCAVDSHLHLCSGTTRTKLSRASQTRDKRYRAYPMGLCTRL